MDRYRRQVLLRRDSGLPRNRDTPIKASRRRQYRKKTLLPSKHFDTVVEESEDGSTSLSAGRRAGAVSANTAPLHRKSVSRFKPQTKTLTPIGHSNLFKKTVANIEASPVPQSFGDGDTPESVTSCSMDTNSTFNLENNGDSTSSFNPSSFSSPEVFRKEMEMQTFHNRKDILANNCKIKNSTLLDASHAESLHTYHPPNISTIIENNSVISYHQESSTQSKTCEMKSPQNFLGRKSTVCRKKVSFKNTIISEPLKVKYVPPPLTIHDTISKLSRAPEWTKPEAETPEVDKISPEKEITVRLKRPAEPDTEKAMFFSFASNSEREAAFQKMRDRSAKLRRSFYFPLTVGT